jgi:hypothetical protein
MAVRHWADNHTDIMSKDLSTHTGGYKLRIPNRNPEYLKKKEKKNS